MGSEEIPLFTRRASGLTREIGLFSTIAMFITFNIGGGVHRLGYWSAYWFQGGDVRVSFLIISILSSIICIVYAWLACSIPRTGGDYIYISRLLHPTIGFWASFSFWLAFTMILGVLSYYGTESLGIALRLYGAHINDPNLMNIGYLLGANANIKFAVAFLVLNLFAVTTFLGTRITRYLINLFFVMPLICAIPMFYLLATSNPANTQAMWDKMFGAGTWSAIQDLAHKTGYVDAEFTTFNLSATMASAAGALWAWSGTPAVVPAVGGEIKEVKRNLLLGVLIGCIISTFYYVLLYVFSFNAYGPTFLTQYIWCYKRAPEELVKIIPNPPFPNAALYAGVLAPHPILQLIISLGVCLWMYNYLPTVYLASSRFVFAWAFDRFFPEKFAELHPRFRTPHYAILASWIVGLVGLYACWASEYGFIGALLAAIDTTPLFDIAFAFTCIAAIILPLMRKDLYDLGFKIEIGGIPLISILGVIGFVASFWIWVWSWSLVPIWPDQILLILMSTIGLLIWLWRFTVLRRKGIDPRSIYAEIPPA
jgi:amino acid transporter